jgi:hypothetical protein
MIQNLQNKQIVINTIISTTLHDPKPETRSKSVESLSKIAGKDAIPHIVKLLSDPEKIVKLSVIQALGKIGNEKAIIYLVEALEKDENSEIKPQIMDAIVAIFNYENELKQPKFKKSEIYIKLTVSIINLLKISDF